MTTETVILGIFWAATVVGVIGGVVAIVAMIRAGGGYRNH